MNASNSAPRVDKSEARAITPENPFKQSSGGDLERRGRLRLAALVAAWAVWLESLLGDLGGL